MALDKLLDQYEFLPDRSPTKEQVKSKIEKRIPKRFLDADLVNTSKKIQEYSAKYSRENTKGFYLYGSIGTGKTYSVCALAIDLLIQGYDVIFYNLPRLLNIIRSSYIKTDSISVLSYDNANIEKLIDVEILIIDDIGAEKTTDWVAETLYHLINTRYENMKTTIFTSNLDMSSLADKVGDRIVSRIAEMSEIYEIEGSDRRLL